MSKNLTKLPLKIVSSMALQTAKKEANSACLLFCYQPKAPESMKKLRKF